MIRITIGLLLLSLHVPHMLRCQNSAILGDDTAEQLYEAEEVSHVPTSAWEYALDESSCFTDDEKQSIRLFFDQIGGFHSWYQVQIVQGINPAHLRCHIMTMNIHPALIARGEKDEKTRISILTNSKSLKSPYLLFKFTSRISSNMRIGGLLEKDIEEHWWTQKGPDFSSLFLDWTPRSPLISRVIVGDFKARLGQGLLFNNQFRRGLVFNNTQIPHLLDHQIKASHSLDENRGLRGLALQAQKNRWHLTTFISHRLQDARLDSIQGTITTLQYSGLHSSKTLIKQKDQAGHWTGGLTLERQLDARTKIQWHGLVDFWSKSFTPSREAYDLITPTSKMRSGFSIEYETQISSFRSFGELALQNHGAFAFVSGWIWNPHSKHRWMCLIRGASMRYDGTYTQSFFQRSQKGNEWGIFAGYVFLPSRQWTLTLNADQYLFPWWTYLQSPFRTGSRINISIENTLRKKRKSALSVRWTTRAQRNPEAILDPNVEKKLNIRLHHIEQWSRGIEWRLRLEYSRTSMNEVHRQGWLHYQEVKYHPLGSPWHLLIRVTIYDTDGYEGRIYAYTHQPGGIFSIPAYFDQGALIYGIFERRWGGFQVSTQISYGQDKNASTNVTFKLGLKVTL